MEGRILALDVGNARTGVAVSDPLGIVASPLDTIQVQSHEADAQTIKDFVEDQEAVRVVVGLPLDQDGDVGPQAQSVLDFIAVLRGVLDVEIVTQDERFSTAAARRGMQEAGIKAKKQKKKIDQVAAQQILQLYLDRESFRRSRES